MASPEQAVALEGRLRGCRNVLTLGVRPNFCDYTAAEAERIRQAETIYYPSALYAHLFQTMGKRTFPSWHSYTFAQDKIRQSALFTLLGIPHPRTRVFYGKRQMETLFDYFQFPFVGKIPRGSARGRGVWLIRNPRELVDYTRHTRIAYIQEFLPIDRDIRVVVIGGEVAHAYWRIAAQGEFCNNLAMGGTIGLDPVPERAICLARDVATACRWDDVGIDICIHQGDCYVLEGNMKYGLEGFAHAGIDYTQLMERRIGHGTL